MSASLRMKAMLTSPKPKTSHDLVSIATAPLLDESKASNIVHEIEVYPSEISPPGWPSQPQVFKLSKLTIISSLLIDVAALGLCVAFLTFGIVVRVYNDREVAGHRSLTDTLLAASKYGPTIFPILFACVLGRACQSILVWRLQKGERLGVLDTLAGSTSLTSTVISQINLGTFGVLGVALITIWLLSPLGGQASLRLVTIDHRIDTSTLQLKYYRPNGNATPYAFSNRGLAMGKANLLFGASLISSEESRTTAIDLWSNVKIPMIEQHERDPLATADEEGWYMVRQNRTVYSSFIGVPTSLRKTAGAGNDLSYEMMLQTSYLNLTCSSPGKYFVDFNKTDQGSKCSSNIYMYVPEYTDNGTHRGDVPLANLEPQAIYLGSPAYLPHQENLIKCNVRTTYVEVSIHCTAPSVCRTTKIRRSRLNNPQPALTILDVESWSGPRLCWGRVSYGFVCSTLTDLDEPSVLTEYIWNATRQTPNGLELTQAEAISLSFSQLFNTFVHGFFGLDTIVAGVLPNATSRQDFSTESRYRPPEINDFNSTARHSFEVIRCHDLWAAALIAVALLLIVAALVPPSVRYFGIEGPYILLNFSNLAARDNPNMRLPATGTYMDAATRAEVSKDVRVRFGDVQAGQAVGKLAIASINTSEDHGVERIKRHRLYQ